MYGCINSKKSFFVESFHTDHLGSSTYLTDNFGRPSHYYDNLPFGETMVEHNQSQYYGNQYKFNGKELDSTTGMYYYGARYYEPRFSIFVSLDPAVEMTMEPYSYVGNNPIMFTDPTGMSKEGGEDWFKKGDNIVWFNRSDSKFTDSNGETWENVGANLNDVKQNLNIPEDTTVKWTTVDALSFGRGDGGRKGALAPVAIKNTAHISFDFSVEGTENNMLGSTLIDGESKISGLDVNVKLSSETNAPGTMLMNVGGNIGLRGSTPLGNRNVVASNPFSDLPYPMLSNSQWHASGQTTMNIGFNRLKNMTHNFTEKPRFTLGINSTVKYQYQLSAKKGFISTSKNFRF